MNNGTMQRLKMSSAGQDRNIARHTQRTLGAALSGWGLGRGPALVV
jgi:hypothetical protein